ncbi:MAG: YcjX family protein, partial [Methylobacteriaceae bacterium]|nr:YcjX family protein [Methylobacteriaceae bacterium]
MASLFDWPGRAGAAAQGLVQVGEALLRPTLRLGVTGLARSGKTVFTTALIHHLVETHALPAFAPAQEGRLRRATLVPQPDDDVPRFPFEEHFGTLTEAR